MFLYTLDVLKDIKLNLHLAYTLLIFLFVILCKYVVWMLKTNVGEDKKLKNSMV